MTFEHKIHNGRQIKKLHPDYHGKKGWRVVSTGRDFRLLREAKAHVDAITS